MNYSYLCSRGYYDQGAVRYKLYRLDHQMLFSKGIFKGRNSLAALIGDYFRSLPFFLLVFLESHTILKLSEVSLRHWFLAHLLNICLNVFENVVAINNKGFVSLFMIDKHHNLYKRAPADS
jgi:hypothetical protein